MPRAGLFFLFKIVLICVLSVPSLAHDMQPEEIYAKCHGRLSDYPVNIDSSDYKSVKAGTLDPIKACEKILNRTMFVNSGTRKLLKNQNDKIAIATLRNFNEFHKSWFTSLGSIPNSQDATLYNFIDHTEPALFITDALFGNMHYSTIFTRQSSIRGFRRGVATDNYVVRNINFKNRKIFSGPVDREKPEAIPENVEVIDFNKVKQGYLTGIEPTPKMLIRPDGRMVRDEITDSLLRSTSEDVAQFDISKNAGGGILGSMAYLNFNGEANSRLNGGVRVHRRMANNTFYDLMCLSLPTLTDKDVNAYMNKYKNSKLSFRKDKSCAQCHASLDPFANAARNHMSALTASNTFRSTISKKEGFSGSMTLRYLLPYKVRINEQSNADNDNLYHRRAPMGELHYRNYDGKRVFQRVNGLSDLGSKIAAQEDIYICAAQRYYHFLTGVNISVAHKSSGNFYETHRKKVVQIGKSLKKHGSLKRMIVDILNTEAFKTRAPNFDLVEGGD